jgi:hypothetical protein
MEGTASALSLGVLAQSDVLLVGTSEGEESTKGHRVRLGAPDACLTYCIAAAATPKLLLKVATHVLSSLQQGIEVHVIAVCCALPDLLRVQIAACTTCTSVP